MRIAVLFLIFFHIAQASAVKIPNSCKELLERVSGEAIIGQIRAISMNPNHPISDEEREQLQKLGILDESGMMSENFERAIISEILNDRPPPRNPDRLARILTQELHKKNMAPGGRGYTFFYVGDLITSKLTDSLKRLPHPEILRHVPMNIESGKLSLPNDLYQYMPDKLRDTYPPSIEVKQWIQSVKNNLSVIEQELPILGEKIIQRALSFLSSDEAAQLKTTNALLRSSGRSTGSIGRHYDNMYLRISIGIAFLTTWVYDPENKEIVGAPEGWALLFSGKKRKDSQPTEHYGPSNRNNEPRHTLFIDLDPR
ncbi:MAG: hypothetical protein KDD40_09320 [Bdellovibrionales bacterium]|nr:hypothetical protein [Bdellovibrionales bacterium]